MRGGRGGGGWWGISAACWVPCACDLHTFWVTWHDDSCGSPAFWADFCRSFLQQIFVDSCSHPSCPHGLWVYVSVGLGRYYPLKPYSVWQCQLAVATARFPLPCHEYLPTVPEFAPGQTVRHQFPSSTIGDEFNRSYQHEKILLWQNTKKLPQYCNSEMTLTRFWYFFIIDNPYTEAANNFLSWCPYSCLEINVQWQ